MSKQRLTIFLCDGKDCRQAWNKVCRDESAGKWLKQLVKEADLPYKLDILKTECMDRCEAAATLCAVSDGAAAWIDAIACKHEADRLLASLRVLAETAPLPRVAAREIIG